MASVTVKDILRLIERAFKFLTPPRKRRQPTLVPVPVRNGQRLPLRRR